MSGKGFRTTRDGVRALLLRNGRPLRFAMAGVINTIFGLAIYPALLWSSGALRGHYMIALGIAQVTSLLFAFAIYKLGVFRTRANVMREFGTFVPFYLINYAANWIALPLLVEWASIPPIVAQLSFSLILMIGSYFWHSRLTFPEYESRDAQSL